MASIPKFHGSSFDWLAWTGGSIQDLGIACRKQDIINKKYLLRKYAIGYCPGEELQCRPKPNCIAIMCIKDDREFWFHINKDEFEEVFGD